MLSNSEQCYFKTWVRAYSNTINIQKGISWKCVSRFIEKYFETYANKRSQKKSIETCTSKYSERNPSKLGEINIQKEILQNFCK